MKKRNNQSHDILNKSLSRRIQILLARTLQSFDDTFIDIKNSDQAQLFKHTLKNSFNDVIRAQRDEIEDYEVDYRPLRFKDDNILSSTRTMINVITDIEFILSPRPLIRIYTKSDKFLPLNALRSEIDAGIISLDGNNSLILEVAGLNDCINKVVPILDRYILSEKNKTDYIRWRFELIKFYRSQGS